MKRKPNLLALMLCISLILHGVIFFTVSLYPINNTFPDPPDSEHAPAIFSLVNLASIEETVPELPLPPSFLPLEELPPPIITGNELTANFIVAEEIQDSADSIGPAEIPAVAQVPAFQHAQSGSAEDQPGSFPGSSNTLDNTGMVNAYIKRNYDYIQRRIRNKLVYPSQARRAGLQGTAELSFTLHENGGVSGVRVLQSSGSDILDTAAMEAIYSAAPFRPIPAPTRMAIPVSFKLR